MPRKSREIVNVGTGEMITLRGSRDMIVAPSKSNTVSPIQAVAGQSTRAINLKDHPEFNGLVIQFERVAWKKKDVVKVDENPLYFLAHVFIFKPGTEPTEADYVKLMSGAEQVVERLQDAELSMEEGTPYPLRGILRLSTSGRTWYLEDTL